MKDRWRKMRKRVLLTEVKESEEERRIKDLGKSYVEGGGNKLKFSKSNPFIDDEQNLGS